jgi:hypothetical protein
MYSYPKVRKVTVLSGRRLLATFDNGEMRIYDCAPLLADPAFRELANEAFFNSVQPDSHGYGVIWSDNVDLSESELWLHGTQAAVENTR